MKLVQLISRELRNGNKAPSTAYEAALGNDGNEAYYTGVYGAAAHKADAGFCTGEQALQNISMFFI